MTTYAEKLLALAELRGENQMRATDPRPFAPVARTNEWSGGQLLTVRVPAAPAPTASERISFGDGAAPKRKHGAGRFRYRKVRPGGVTWTLLRLAASGDCFDRHDVEEQCVGAAAKSSIGSLASVLCRDGLAKVVVKGGWWVPPGKGQALSRPTTWRGTPAAQRVWAIAKAMGDGSYAVTAHANPIMRARLMGEKIGAAA
jgi:hypothetical protein